MRTKTSLRHASGFSLLEVLVAIVVLSFGLLGVAGLQATALQNNREARLQSVAVDLAREMGEMMRGNKDVAIQAGALNPYLGTFTAAPSTAANCLATGNGCATRTDVASAQLTEWLTRVQNDLPAPKVVICGDSQPYDANGLPQWPCTNSTGGDVIVIKIGWTSRSTNATTVDATRLRKATDDNPPLVIIPVTAGLT